MKVKSKDGRMEPNYEAAGRIIRYIGWSHKAGVWTRSEDPVEVPLRAEYIQALRSGALEPACDVSAKYVKGNK